MTLSVGRDCAVSGQTFQPGFAGMDSESLRPAAAAVHKRGQQCITVQIVNADPMLHGYRQICCFPRFHAVATDRDRP